MNAQETFDKIVGHLRRQGKKALDHDDKCKYRAPDGSKCAGGCLIPDHLYKPKFEGRRIRNLVRNYGALHVFGTNDPDIDVVGIMQDIHDTIAVEHWEDKFKTAASFMCIEYTPPIAA